jgi:hypothetical protein
MLIRWLLNTKSLILKQGISLNKETVFQIKISAKTGECIDEAFKKIISMSLDSLEKQQETITESNHILKPATFKDPKRKCFEKLQNYLNGISKFFHMGGSPNKDAKTDEANH